MTKNKKGFTIIEVVLVLAIAGLIFLMVFIALPALQRSQRNTRRRQDMARILSSFTEYSSNNNGKVPGSGDFANFVNKYINGGGDQGNSGTCAAGYDQFCDPDGTGYKFVGPTALSSAGASATVSNASSAISSITGTNKDVTISGKLDHQIYYFTNATCDSAEGKVTYSAGSRDIALEYILEGGAVYCGDNH